MNNIQTSLEYLAGLCLEVPQEFQNYTDEDLLNATLIFSHFLLDAIWKTNQDMKQKKREELADYTGKAIRELIKTATGKDMRKVTKEVLK